MRIILIRLVIMILAVMPGLLPAQDAGGPRIEVSEIRFHAGKVVQGSRVSHVFEIKNTGTGTLVIERIEAG